MSRALHLQAGRGYRDRYRLSGSCRSVYSATPMGTVTPLHELRKEQLAAVVVLQQKLAAGPVLSLPRRLEAMPPSGFTLFTQARMSPRRMLRLSSSWIWNQSHRKVTTMLAGERITLRKLLPKRIVPHDACAPLPKYKLWLLDVGEPATMYFMWVAKGDDSDAPMVPVSMDSLSHGSLEWPSSQAPHGFDIIDDFYAEVGDLLFSKQPRVLMPSVADMAALDSVLGIG